MKIRITALILSLLLLLSFASCTKSNGAETDTSDSDIITLSEEESDYLAKYADAAMAESWIKNNITDSNCPPVNFIIDDKDSDSLTWKKEFSEVTKVIDYPETTPAERAYYTVTFTNEEYNLAVDVVVTSYPGYPVVEYSATIKNLSDENSKLIRSVYSVNRSIFDTDEDMTIRYSHGSTDDGSLDYREITKSIPVNGKTLRIDTDQGKPTNDYLPNFSFEKDGGDGVIAVLSWQGGWKTEFRNEDNGLKMSAGQYQTEFNLLGKETHRCPTLVLIFYKDSYVYGQNIYRRWFYKHNFMRVSGEKMPANVLVSTAGHTDDESLVDVQSTADYDLYALRAVKAYAFERSIDRFCQDAGWNEYKVAGKGTWINTVGSWGVDKVRYPNGLKEVADAAAELGLGYTLWIEPERVAKRQDISNEHPEYIIYCDTESGKSVYVSDNDASTGKWGLFNMGNPDALAYITDVIDNVIKEQGVTSYRQDFNIFPEKYWAAYDEKEAKDLGIKRRGRTEEQHCNGYLKFLDSLIERNPGLTIDACASGGMRYDLDTARRAYCHTRTDFFGYDEKAQSDTYVTSKWLVYWGGPLTGTTDYAIRSRLSLDVGIGIYVNEDFDFKTYFNSMSTAIRKWRNLNSFITEDYYPLTEYLDPRSEGVIGYQYDCPSKSCGLILAFVRGLGFEETLYPYGLDESATYEWYSLDDEKNIHTSSGKELMEKGFTVVSGTPEKNMVSSTLVGISYAYVYRKV